MIEDLVTLGDAASELGLRYQNVYRAYMRGRVPYVRAGSAILVRVADVEAAMATFKPRPTAVPRVANAKAHTS